MFMVKLKDWEHPKTKIGFVVNSSNFYNEDSQKFRKYFFSNYKVETIYDLSEIKIYYLKMQVSPLLQLHTLRVT